MHLVLEIGGRRKNKTQLRPGMQNINDHRLRLIACKGALNLESCMLTENLEKWVYTTGS